MRVYVHVYIQFSLEKISVKDAINHQHTSEYRVERHEIRGDGQRDHCECECQEFIYDRSVVRCRRLEG